MNMREISEVHSDICYELQKLIREMEILEQENESLKDELEELNASKNEKDKVKIFRNELKNLNESIRKMNEIGIKIIDFENCDFCIDNIFYDSNDDEVYFKTTEIF